MYKKLMLACMAIAAFAAFVVAPAASASPALTDEGKLLASGSSFTGKNTGETKFTGSVNVNCSKVDLVGTLTENTGSSIKGTIPVGGASFKGTGTNEDCTSNLLGAPASVTVNSELCIATVKGADTVTVDGCIKKTVINEKEEEVTEPLEFTLNITGSGPCKYRETSDTGTYVTAAAASVTLTEQPANTLVEGGSFCPSSGKLDMTFDLYTTGGTVALSIS